MAARVAVAILVAATVATGTGAGARAGAQTTAPNVATTDPGVAAAEAEVAALRAEADAVAGRYFAELDRLNALGRRIDDTEARVGALTAEVARLRTRTRDRAVAAYLRAATGLPPVLGAGDAVTATRRVRWLRQLNAGDDAAAADLRAASAQLAAERSDLRRSQVLAAAALEEVRAEGRVVDARLSAAEDRRRAAVAAATTTTTAARPGPTAPPAPSVGPGPTPPPVPSTPPPGYVPTPGTHPRHDEAFLVCTRARESGGNYGAVNRAGPYLGAYQFLQATWNVTAAHAGRPGLVGVPPHTASPYDQDDLAWALYQWQGSRPWGGHCDPA